MLKPSRLVLTGGLMGLLLIGLPRAALADWGDVTCEVNDPYCEIAAGDEGNDESSGPPSNDNDGGPPAAEEGDESICGDLEYDDLPVEEWPAECLGGEPQAVAIAELTEIAHNRLVLPAPESASSPADRQLVHLPVWLALTESSWRSVSASASAGAVTVTATATPSRVEWELGDGSTVACNGPGTVWRPGMDPEAVSPDCGHTYTHSVSEVEVTATVFWTVTWESTTGSSGGYADLATSSQAVWEVAEARSVIVR